MNNLQEKLLEQIKNGEVSMTPRWYFVMRGILWALATIIVMLVTIYCLSFILFILRENGVFFAPFYGWAGVVVFVTASPWLLLGTVLLFVGVLYVLVSQYAFSYKKPMLYSLLGVVCLVIILAGLIDQVQFHERANYFIKNSPVPGLAPWYAGAGSNQPKSISRGVIVELSTYGFLLDDKKKSGVLEVVITDATKMPPQIIFQPGQSVIVFGPEHDGVVEAFGVRMDKGRCCELSE